MRSSLLRRLVDAGRRRGRRAVTATAIVGFAIAGRGAAGGDLLVPPDVRASLAVRLLEYDRALKTWAGTELTVGVLVKSADGADGAEFLRELRGRAARSIPVKPVEHVYHDADALRSWIGRNNVRLLYVAVDIGADSAVLSAAAAQKIASIVATRAQFERGATLGIVVKDGRPRILVNLPSAKAAGMELDPKLLELSEVVH